MIRTYKEKRIGFLHRYFVIKRILKMSVWYADDSYSEFGKQVNKFLVKEGFLEYETKEGR